MNFATPQRTNLSLKSRALRLLSGREHSRHELERCLANFEAAPGELVKILDELEGKGFISEARVVESVINRRSPKLGAARIRQELHARGLDQHIVAAAVASLQATELERAREVWRKKFGTLATDAAERVRQMRFLASRGFAPEAIRKVTDGGLED